MGELILMELKETRMENQSIYGKSIAIVILLSLFAIQVQAQGEGIPSGMPPLPLIVKGAVKIKGEDAPVGTVITAKIDDQLAGNINVKNAGQFAIAVTGQEGDEGKVVKFYINNIEADQTTIWESGKVEILNLSIGEEAIRDDTTESNGSSLWIYLILTLFIILVGYFVYKRKR